jgi:hypothetical protein
LRCQMLEGVRIRQMTFGGTHKSGPCHVHMQDGACVAQVLRL